MGPQGFPPEVGIFGFIILIIFIVFVNYPSADEEERREKEKWKPTPDRTKSEQIKFEQEAKEYELELELKRQAYWENNYSDEELVVEDEEEEVDQEELEKHIRDINSKRPKEASTKDTQIYGFGFLPELGPYKEPVFKDEDEVEVDQEELEGSDMCVGDVIFDSNYIGREHLAVEDEEEDEVEVDQEELELSTIYCMSGDIRDSYYGDGEDDEELVVEDEDCVFLSEEEDQVNYLINEQEQEDLERQQQAENNLLELQQQAENNLVELAIHEQELEIQQMNYLEPEDDEEEKKGFQDGKG